MSLQVAIQMDHIKSIDPMVDSTLALGIEAQARGHTLYHYQPENLSLQNGQVTVVAQEITLANSLENHYKLGADFELNLTSIDVVLMRQDPPFDMAYITATHILENIHPKTLVVNDPKTVRNSPEKLFVMQFPELMPPTLITGDRDKIIEFRKQQSDIIIKPLYGNGGSGVFHIKAHDENMNSLLEMFGNISREPLIVQKYLPEVRNGDKRIILIEGTPAGAINRIPATGESRSNMHVGGRAVATDLSDRDLEICQHIGPALKEQNLLFVGIDIIGEFITEINVTSPTGLREIALHSNKKLEVDVWNAIEERLSSA